MTKRSGKQTDVRDLAALWLDRFGLDCPVAKLSNARLQALAPILGRGSVREYRADPVPETLLSTLLACAQSAPTKSNLQQYSIIDVRDPALRSALGELAPRMPWLATAPVFLVFLGDVRRNRRLAQWRGHAYRNNNADSFMNAAVDAALAMQSFTCAAEAVGLGCCPISVIRNRIGELKRLLALPEGVFPVAGLTAGWPSGPVKVSMRLPPSVVVHRDRYDDGEMLAEVAAYDERAHARAPIPPERQRHTDRYGVLDKCPWSENVARQLSVPERADFGAFLAEQDLSLD